MRASSTMSRTQRSFGDGRPHRADDRSLDLVRAPATHPKEPFKVDAAGGRGLRGEGIRDVDPGADALGDACQERKRDTGATGGLRASELRDGAGRQTAKQKAVDCGDAGGRTFGFDTTAWRKCGRDARRKGRFDLLAKLGGVGQGFTRFALYSPIAPWNSIRIAHPCPTESAGTNESEFDSTAASTPATLVIAKLDRLACNVAFISNLMEAGVELGAVDMPQANRFTVHILVAVAEREAEAISNAPRRRWRWRTPAVPSLVAIVCVG